jgi:hypothetical protein
MKNFVWIILVIVGVGIMAVTAFVWQQPKEPTPWTYGFLFTSTTSEDIPATSNLNRPYVRALIKLLPNTEAKHPLMRIRPRNSQAAKFIDLWLMKKVILFPEMEEHIKKEYLAWGRLPLPGANEVICGAQISNKTPVSLNWEMVSEGVDGPQQKRIGKRDILDREMYEVVGGLQPEITLFQKCYLLPFHQRYEHAKLFEPDGTNVRIAYLFPADSLKHFLSTGTFLQQKFFSKDKFCLYSEPTRVSHSSYYFYLLGMIFFLIGGTFLITRFYIYLAPKFGNHFLGSPLNEINKHRTLFLIMHLVTFGLTILCMAIIYQLPTIQEWLMAYIGAESYSEKSLLGIAGNAYGSGNVLYAILVTVLINYLWATLVTTTLPSVIIPGIGILLVFIRAVFIGFLLAPAYTELSACGLTHYILLLLEFEGYILASFFALLVPLYLILWYEKGEPIWRRYLHGLLINAKATIVIFIVLLIAAIYEAVEIIIILP